MCFRKYWLFVEILFTSAELDSFNSYLIVVSTNKATFVDYHRNYIFWGVALERGLQSFVANFGASAASYLHWKKTCSIVLGFPVG